MQMRYFGWSGIAIQHANILVGFDLYGDEITWAALKQHQLLLFCLTHGHPEHAGSLQAFLEAPEARPYLANVHLISSLEVIKHINRHNLLAAENIHPIGDREQITIAGIQITAFDWVHMPLLPPGLREKVSYILQLLLHPVDLIRIGTLGLSLPMNAPQLGFHLTYPNGVTVLNYSEGIHRLTDRQEVAQVAHDLPAGTVLFAVEPDDAEAIPQWIKLLAPHQVYIYEAHRPWRDLFHLPFIDLEQYAQKLSAQFPGITFTPLVRAHQVVERIDDKPA